MLRRSKIILALLLVLGLGAGSAISPSAWTQAQAQDGVIFRRDQLRIISNDTTHVFHIEIAETPRQRSQGLMWRRRMAANTGMLFDFESAAPVVMWMKNTYIPLDMMFITADGIILNIARGTKPHSTTFIPSAGPVRAVFEVPAGTVARLGIRAGDRIAHAIFTRPKKRK